MKIRPNFVSLPAVVWGLSSFSAPFAAAQQPDTAAAVVTSVAPVAVAPIELSVIAGKDDKAEGNQGMFEFGTISMMEPSHDLDGVDPRTLWQNYHLSGLKHIFTLQNKTDRPIEARSFRHQAMIETQLWKGGKGGKSLGLDEQFTLAPGERIGIEVAFDYNRAGVAKHTVWLVDIMGAGKGKPLATLAMAGNVESGLSFSEETLNFGQVARGRRATATFSLTFDRRTPENIPPGVLKLICKNPLVRIYSIPEQSTVMGVQVKGDTLVFPNSFRAWPKDLTLNFGVELSPQLPVGNLKEKVSIIAQGLPLFAIVKQATLSLQANVVNQNSETKAEK